MLLLQEEGGKVEASARMSKGTVEWQQKLGRRRQLYLWRLTLCGLSQTDGEAQPGLGQRGHFHVSSPNIC